MFWTGAYGGEMPCCYNNHLTVMFKFDTQVNIDSKPYMELNTVLIDVNNDALVDEHWTLVILVKTLCLMY